MKFLGYLYRPILQIFDYRGKASRAEFWVWIGFTWIFTVAWAALLNRVPMQLHDFAKLGIAPQAASVMVGLIRYAPLLIMGLVSIPLMARRYNQSGRSKAFLWIFIGGVGCTVTYSFLMLLGYPLVIIAGPVVLVQLLLGDKPAI